MRPSIALAHLIHLKDAKQPNKKAKRQKKKTYKAGCLSQKRLRNLQSLKIAAPP